MFGDVTAFARAVATLPNRRMQRNATQRLCVEANELNKWCVGLVLIDDSGASCLVPSKGLKGGQATARHFVVFQG